MSTTHECQTPLGQLIQRMRAEVDAHEADRKSFSCVVPQANDKIRGLLDLVESLYAIASTAEVIDGGLHFLKDGGIESIQTVESLRGPRWDTLKTEQEWCAANGAWRCGLARWANGMIATYPAPTCAIEHKPVSR